MNKPKNMKTFLIFLLSKKNTAIQRRENKQRKKKRQFWV